MDQHKEQTINQSKGIEGMEKFIKSLDKWVAGAAAFCLILCFGILCFEVIYRYFYNDTHEWAPELSIILLMWTVFLAGGPALLRDQHIRMGVLIEKIGGRFSGLISSLMYAIITILCLLMTWKGAALAAKSIKLGVSTPAFEPFPVGYFKLSIPIGMGFFALYAIFEMIKHFMTFIKQR